MSGVLKGAAISSVIDVSATSTWPLLPLIAMRGCLRPGEADRRASSTGNTEVVA